MSALTTLGCGMAVLLYHARRDAIKRDRKPPVEWILSGPSYDALLYELHTDPMRRAEFLQASGQLGVPTFVGVPITVSAGTLGQYQSALGAFHDL